MAKKKKICVIGAGLGGLSAAIRLANYGYEVDVFDKNAAPGGKAGEIKNSGFRFDTGPSLLTMPFILEDLFIDSGEKINDYLPLKRLEIICMYYYPDGTIINAFSNASKFAEEIENKTLDSSASVLKYLKYCEKIYNLTSDLFLNNSLSELKTFLNFKAIKTLVNIKSIDAFRTMHKANASYFKDKKNIQLFDRYATYNGSNPFLAPATLNIIQHVEYNLGAYVPLNGIYSISESLEKLGINKGVKYFYNSDVEEIIHESKIVNGIRVNGEKRDYDIVVSNSDVKLTYEKLLKDINSKIYKKYNNNESSTSAIVFYWGIKGNNKQLEIHNIIFSDDYKNEFHQLFEEKRCPSDPTIYIYVSSKFNKDDAPEGHENWFVMINAPNNETQNWENEITRIRKTIVNKVNKNFNIDIDSQLAFEEIMTPVDIEYKTRSSKGSIYGLSSNNKYTAFLRQQNKSKEYKNLYFCGGSAHPGGGIPLVLLSGKIASELINKYES